MYTVALLLAWQGLADEPAELASHQQEILEGFFEHFDKNGDNFVDHAEMRAMIEFTSAESARRGGYATSEADKNDVMARLAELDLNRDGRWSKDEMREMVADMPDHQAIHEHDKSCN